jgi:Holliday junction resolvase RusA-like endonuclease
VARRNIGWNYLRMPTSHDWPRGLKLLSNNTLDPIPPLCGHGGEKGLMDQQQVIIFDDVPMPPSLNNAYPTVKTRTGFRRVKGPGLIQYRRDMMDYYLVNKRQFITTKQFVQEWLSKEWHFIQMDIAFAFAQDQLLTKQLKPKRMDLSNRIKAVEDMICELLGIDDSLVWGGFYEKALADSGKSHCLIILQQRPARALTQIKNSLPQELGLNIPPKQDLN